MSELGLIAGIGLLVFLALRGMNLLIAAPLCALLVALFAGINVFPDDGGESFVTSYMSGFAGFVTDWYLMFLLGALFGKVMEDCGAAEAVSKWVTNRFGAQRALLATVAACAILTYGGVSLFVVAFSVFPMALALFKQANLPRRFLPATIAFGSVTFTMTSAGSPEIQNWIPIQYLGTTPYAGWQVSLVVAIFMAAAGYLWLKRMVGRAVANGEVFDIRASDPETHDKALPHPLVSMLPLLVVLVSSLLLHDALGKWALLVALLSGIAAAVILNWRYFLTPAKAIEEGTLGSLLAIGNTAAVVGFGAVAKTSPAFAAAVEMMTAVPGSALIGAAIAVTTIAALTGSASGGQSIALPILAPVYLDQGVDPEQLHRVVAISSGALDTLPHNGYVVTTIRAICGETHQAAYGPMAALTLVVPLVGMALAILLFVTVG